MLGWRARKCAAILRRAHLWFICLTCRAPMIREFQAKIVVAGLADGSERRWFGIRRAPTR